MFFSVIPSAVTKSSRSGAALDQFLWSVHPDAIEDHITYHSDDGWSSDYWAKVMSSEKSLPRPVMVGGAPYMSGDLSPHGKDPCYGYEFLCTMDGKKYAHIEQNRIRSPNLNEYNKYFKHIIDNEVFYIGQFRPKARSKVVHTRIQRSAK